MKTFNVLKQDCEILGKKLLEASAGTGKTFAIEHIVLRLLLLGGPSITIDQILVVTFTKAATKELKYRIRKNIEKALSFLQAKDCEKNEIFEYLIPFRNHNEAIFKLQNAIDLFETAQIFTIHSFCFKSLQEFAIEGDILINLDHEGINTEIIKKFILNYLKYNIDPKRFSQQQIEILINKNRNIDRLSKKLIHLITNGSNAKEYKVFHELFDELKIRLELFEEEEILKAVGSFNEISSNYKRLAKFKEDNFHQQLNLFLDVIRIREASDKKLHELIQMEFTLCEFIRDENKKIKAKNFVLPSIFQKILKQIYPVIKEIIDPQKILSRLSDEISSELESFLQDEELLSFDKILYKMKEAIKNSGFSSKIKNKYKAALIDEFQDTDPVQFEIFEKLFLKSKNIKAFYLIGDPKQSIYSFRKADLYTYLEATEKINRIHYLDTNFRSSKALIESLNALFSENFSRKWLKLPKNNKNLSYSPIKSGLNEEFHFSDDFSPIHFFIGEDNYKTKKWPSENLEFKYFDFITNEIIKLKRQHNFLDKNFAVLVKDRYQAQRLKNYFQKFSLMSITAKASSLKNSKALSAFEDFFDAVLDPFNLNKVKIALKGPFLQFEDSELTNIESHASEILGNFYILKSSLSKGLGLFFSSFFDLKWPNRTILEKISSKKDLNFYQDVISLTEIFISENHLSKNQILTFFEKIKSLDEDDGRLKSNYQEESGIHILTTFMSKGLEYDIVFALGLASGISDSSSEDLNEIDAEKMRQLYVALTRAKNRVYVPIAIDLKKKHIEKGSYSCIEYFFSHVLNNENYIDKQLLISKLDELKLKKLISYSFIENVKVENFVEKAEEIKLENPTSIKKEFPTSYIYSFSSLQKETNYAFYESKHDETFPTGPHVGTIIHNIFEKIFNKKSYETNTISKIINDHVLDTELKEFENKLFDLINKALETPLLDNPSFCLKDVPSKNVKPEVEFLFKNDNDYIKGFIDLFFQYQSKYYIIDWKTNHLGHTKQDYSVKNIENEMNHHNYFLQAAIYTESLKRHLKILNKEFNKVFGGVLYIFIRGLEFEKTGIYHFFPDLSLLSKLSKKDQEICFK